jgi:hypothetical protein
MSSLGSKLMTVAAIGAATISGTAIATAATGGSSSSSSTTAQPPQSSIRPPAPRDPSQAGHMANGKTETLLSGDTAAKVRAAALAKVSGTVERVETNVDSSAPYEAHIVKSDGTEVEVQVNSDFTVAECQHDGWPASFPRTCRGTRTPSIAGLLSLFADSKQVEVGVPCHRRSRASLRALVWRDGHIEFRSCRLNTSFGLLMPCSGLTSGT